MNIGKPEESVVDADALATVANIVADCRREADRRFGQLAYEWHRERSRTRGDLRPIIVMWRRAIAHATTADRKAAFERNLGIAVWDHAAFGGARAIEWVDAGEALLTSPLKELADAAIDGYDNALRAARATKMQLPPIVVARLRGGLQKIGGERARKLLAELP